MNQPPKWEAIFVRSKKVGRRIVKKNAQEFEQGLKILFLLGGCQLQHNIIVIIRFCNKKTA
ncbi:MAG: hypothetical protein C0403_03845 [Desulfobacterium sp.]|nr:hypothetical protein [Desulfobacterium sp.]